MPDVLLYSDTERNAAMRHEVPIAVGDPFGYAEVDGRAVILTSSLEQERIAAVRPDAELIEWADVGFFELLESGIARDQIMLELVSRAVARTSPASGRALATRPASVRYPPTSRSTSTFGRATRRPAAGPTWPGRSSSASPTPRRWSSTP